MAAKPTHDRHEAGCCSTAISASWADPIPHDRFSNGLDMQACCQGASSGLKSLVAYAEEDHVLGQIVV